MSDNEQSGNRWEPADAAENAASEAASIAEPIATPIEAPIASPAAAETSTDLTADATIGPTADPAPTGPFSSGAPAAGPTWATRGRLLAAAAVAGVFLVGGLSGFAVGRTTADDPGNVGSSFGPGNVGDRDGRGFDGDHGPGQGGFPGGPGGNGGYGGFGGQPPSIDGQGSTGQSSSSMSS